MGKMHVNILKFFQENQICDLLPVNQKLVVLNNEMTVAQAIEAMIRQQNVKVAILWDNKKREYEGLFTLRDLLECMLYVGEKLQEVLNLIKKQLAGGAQVQVDPQQFNKLIKENWQKIRYQFMDKYVYNAFETNQQDSHMKGAGNEEAKNQSKNGARDYKGFELINKVFDQITLQDWVKIQRSSSSHFSKAELIDLEIT
mmetsp:Transcript_8654/g.14661  ORF Transcript_8654/g.14661 Transcript_8654/m.14661 type:complete len:199 (+) Transcript_8654:184-780(+)